MFKSQDSIPKATIHLHVIALEVSERSFFTFANLVQSAACGISEYKSPFKINFVGRELETTEFARATCG
jgi:hypothetical protein